jgi:hypothetical protein
VRFARLEGSGCVEVGSSADPRCSTPSLGGFGNSMRNL